MSSEIENIITQFINEFKDEYFWIQKLDEPGQPVQYSESVINVTGYSSEEMSAMPGNGSEIIFDEDYKKFKRSVDDLLKSDNNFLEFELRITRKNGRIIHVKEELFIKRNEQGKSQSLFGKVTNIEKYKDEVLTAQKKADGLKEVNASKDNFISMLSHNLRAPFTSILGFSEILLNEEGLSDSERLEYLKYINDSSQHQLQLINDLLDWSRLKTGKLQIEPQRTHAQSLVYNSVSSLTGNAVRKNIDIKVHVPETLYIEADERLIMQVIINLLRNAIKFSPENSTVELYANTFNTDYAEFVIKDEGIGIDEEQKEKLFKIGMTFSREGTKGEKGTGLGLALSKEIIDKHNGEIWYYSTAGEGSEFHFIVPASPNIILLVKKDDEERDEIINKLKEKYPKYIVLGAENGYEALEILVSKMPSLIITDHDMPLMNGIQLVQAIKKNNKNLTIPIIALVNPNAGEIKTMYQQYGIKTFPEDNFDVDMLDENYFLMVS